MTTFPAVLDATPATTPGWRVVRVLDAAQGWVVCQQAACWLHLDGLDGRILVPGVVDGSGEALWPANRDDLGERIPTAILEPGQHITAAELDDLVRRGARSRAAVTTAARHTRHGSPSGTPLITDWG